MGQIFQVQATNGCCVYRKFKTVIKSTKSQCAFYYYHMKTILKNGSLNVHSTPNSRLSLKRIPTSPWGNPWVTSPSTKFGIPAASSTTLEVVGNRDLELFVLKKPKRTKIKHFLQVRSLASVGSEKRDDPNLCWQRFK